MRYGNVVARLETHQTSLGVAVLELARSSPSATVSERSETSTARATITPPTHRHLNRTSMSGHTHSVLTLDPSGRISSFGLPSSSHGGAEEAGMIRAFRRAASVLAIATVLLVQPAAASVLPPTLLSDEALELDYAETKAIYIATPTPISVIVAGAPATVACQSQPPMKRVSCDPTDGIVEVAVTAGNADGSGFVVVTNQSGSRSTSVALSVAAMVEDPVQPSALTVTIEGCESLYNSRILRCPDGSANGSVTEELGEGLELSAGAAIVTGEMGSAGKVVLTAGEPMTLEVSGLDRFGTFEGKVGSGDSEVSLTVKRRAPVALGALAVALGAGLAAAVSWFTAWATDSAAAKKTVQRFRRNEDRLSVRYDRLRHITMSRFWGLDTPKPARLESASQRDVEQVDAYESAANDMHELWDTLEALVSVRDFLAPETTRGSDGQVQPPLARWVLGSIAAGYTGVGNDPRLKELLQLTLRALTTWGPGQEPQLAAIRAAGNHEELEAAFGIPGLTARTDDHIVSVQVDGESNIVVASPPRETHWWTRLPGMSWLPRWWVAVILAAGWCLVCAFVLEPRDGISPGDARVLAFLGAALIIVLYIVAHAVDDNGIGVVVAGLIGALLSVIIDAGSALDPNAAWGGVTDVLAAVGTSFAVGGGAQILRFGFPTKDAV